MKIREITAAIESFAPLAVQEGFDNAGLLVGDPNAEISEALLCVDVTEAVLDEAVEAGIGLIVSHHPIIFHPLRHITGETYVQRVVARAIRENVALYACHTNLDGVAGGMSWRLAAMLGLTDVRLLSRTRADDPTVGFGVVGSLPSPVGTTEFLKTLQRTLSTGVIRHSELCRETVKTVAVCSGSGASLIPAAKAAGADMYVAADFKYNDFLDADGCLVVADVGHFESEYHAIDLLHDIIQKKIPTFALRKSRNSRNPVCYFAEGVLA